MSSLIDKAQLSQARAMLDVVFRRISALPPADRAELEPQAIHLRERLAQVEQDPHALDEAMDGLANLILQMDARYAGHPPAPPR
jgi:hypothetical protein